MVGLQNKLIDPIKVGHSFISNEQLSRWVGFSLVCQMFQGEKEHLVTVASNPWPMPECSRCG